MLKAAGWWCEGPFLLCTSTWTALNPKGESLDKDYHSNSMSRDFWLRFWGDSVGAFGVTCTQNANPCNAISFPCLVPALPRPVFMLFKIHNN